ncbi:MAG: hypothetical protein QM713_14620 [Arachnia sp.]
MSTTTRVRRGRPRVAALAILIAAALSGCGGSDPPDPERTITLPARSPAVDPTVDPETDDPLEGFCNQQTAPTEECWSSWFGNNLRALNDAMELEVGPGGLKRITATQSGLGEALPVNQSTVGLVESVEEIKLSHVLWEQAGCTVLWDPNTFMGAAIDAAGYVEAFLIANPVVETYNGHRIGHTLDDLRQEFDLDVADTELGRVALALFPDQERGVDDDEPGRAIRFHLTDDNRVTTWMVGTPSWVLSPNLCPAA